MTFRADITINWGISPRIVTVLAPSTTVSIQDLVDTLRTHEAYMANLDDFKILDAYGKIQIGPGVYTSISAVLRNALLAFEARIGPGYTRCKVLGGNLVAKDAGGVIIDSPMHPTAFVYPEYAASTDGSLLEGSGSVDPLDEAMADHVIPGSVGRVIKDTYDTSIDTYNLAADIGDLVDDLHDEALGKWTLNPATSTLTLFRGDGSVLKVFNLKVAVGDVPPYVERTPA